MERTFDRVPQFDERSLNYPIRTLLPDQPRSYTWRLPAPEVLDQGREGACVGHAWAHEVAAPPKRSLSSSNLAFHIYREAQKVDEWSGEAYSGTSVLAGAKIVQSLGHMDEYRWCFSLADIALAVGRQGPVVVGLNWYSGMFSPDADGYIHPTGSLAGGHAILCNGVNIKRRRFMLTNSWGRGWGRDGTCFISFDELDRLLHEQGDACVPVRRRKS